MIRPRIVYRLARAEMRRARGSLAFCIASIAVGVMAITLILSLAENLRNGVNGQAKELMGGDLLLSSSQPFENEGAVELLRNLAALGATETSSIKFFTMLRRVSGGEPDGDGHTSSPAQASGRSAQLVRLRATPRQFPLYGHIRSEPPGQYEKLSERASVLLDPGVARTLGLEAGDQVQVGELTANVLGHFLKKPGSPAAKFSMAPYVFLDARFLPETGLLATGSRIRYEHVFALPPSVSATAWKNEHSRAARTAHVSIRSFDEAGASLQRLSGFLTLVALITLFLGALGVGSGLRTFLRKKHQNAALLRSFGATGRDVLKIYGLLTLLVAGAGSALGAGLGSALPLAFGQFSENFGTDLLPVELDFVPSVTAVGRAFATGVCSSMAFALLPVWTLAQIPPLRVLGHAGTSALSIALKARLTLLAIPCLLVTGVVFGLSEPGGRAMSFAFTLAFGGAWLALALLSRAVTALAGKLGPRLKNFHLRQGIANLHRPENQTEGVIVAVGLAFVMLGTLLIVQHSLEQTLRLENDTDHPNFFVVEAQPPQLQDIRKALVGAQARNVADSPMISARIGALNGVPIDTSAISNDSRQRTRQDRFRTREYFVSHRETLVDSEFVVAGTFWRGRPAQQEASLDSRVAQALGARLGDTLTLDVQGRPLDARITSFREIQWLSLRPNAMILLSPGPIEKAPGMVVFSAQVPDSEQRHLLEGKLLARFPNLTVIDAEQAAQSALLIVNGVANVLHLLGLAAVLAGALVFCGAIAAGRFAREREAMLLKVLGASRSDLRRILTSEYLSLAVLGVSCGWLIAEGLNRLAVGMFFDAQPAMPYFSLLALATSGILLHTGMAVLVGRRVSNATPLSILREG